MKWELIKVIIVFTIVLLLGNIASATVSKTIDVDVIETKGISLFFTPVNTFNTSFDVVVDRNTNFLRDTYPLSDDGLNVVRDGWGIEAAEDLSDSLLLRIGQILKIQYKILNKAFLAQQNFTNVIGIVKEGYLYPMHKDNPTGVNFDLGEPGVILIDEAQLKTLTHEVSHTFGFCEEYDSEAWEKQNNTLKEEGGCANGDLDGDGYLDGVCIPYGCPTQTFSEIYDYGNISDDDQLYNFMGLGDTPSFSTTPPSNFESWVSDDSYSALLDKLDVNSDFTIPSLKFINYSLGYIVINLFFEKDESVDILDAYILDNGFINNKSEYSGNYTLEVLNGSDAVISNISFEPEFEWYAENGSIIYTNSTFIIFALPLENQMISKFRFKNLTDTLAEVNKTPNEPVVNLISPIGGEFFKTNFSIEWNASDADSDDLAYAILISADNGSTWTTLDFNYTDINLSVDVSYFDRGHEYLIKVLATDGINTGENISDSTFSIIHPTTFAVKDSSGNNKAVFDGYGSLELAGSCSVGSCDDISSALFVVKDSGDSAVAYIDTNGNLCLEAGDCSGYSASCVAPDNAFVVRDGSDVDLAYIDSTGDLCLTGSLVENGSP